MERGVERGDAWREDGDVRRWRGGIKRWREVGDVRWREGMCKECGWGHEEVEWKEVMSGGREGGGER